MGYYASTFGKEGREDLSELDLSDESSVLPLLPPAPLTHRNVFGVRDLELQFVSVIDRLLHGCPKPHFRLMGLL